MDAQTKVVGALSLLLLGTLVVLATVQQGSGRPNDARDTSRTPPSLAVEAGRAFLDAYVDADGRVVRRDHSGDTVSEGQAYAMLVAVALRDSQTFYRVWGWTERHLQRPDGLLAWRWQDGRIADETPASDADLDAARALSLAGQAFDDARLTEAAGRIARAILHAETAWTTKGLILVAGPWATAAPYVHNPSYVSPVATTSLSRSVPDPRWGDLEAGGRELIRAVLETSQLPPDWVTVGSDAVPTPRAGADGQAAEGAWYGYDAARTPIRLAESCNPTDKELAARLVAPLDREPGPFALRRLDGTPIGDERSVVAASGTAAARAAAGNAEGAWAALHEANKIQLATPTYYGAAWIALGAILLTDPSMGGCPPLA